MRGVRKRPASRDTSRALWWVWVVAACSANGAIPAPDTLPFRLDVTQSFGLPVIPVDLQGDSDDEFLITYHPGQPAPAILQSVMLQTINKQAIEQLNYEGRVGTPRFLDLDGDGRGEILVPLVRNDSFFLSVASAAGKKQFGFLLATGRPRVEPEGELRWDPDAVDFYVLDIDGDGTDELITIVLTGFARSPRGILAHRLPGGQLVSRWETGAFITQSDLRYLGPDSVPTVLFGTAATQNGAVAGGFDDLHSYVIAVRLTDQPSVVWSRETGGLGTVTRIAVDDHNGDGSEEMLAITFQMGHGPGPAVLAHLDLTTGLPVRTRTVLTPLVGSALVDLDRDSRAEILMAERGTGSVWRFSDDFESVRQRRIAPEIGLVEVWPDVDGDGFAEVSVRIPNDGFVLLDSDLRIKARYPRGGVTGVVHRGIGEPRALLASVNPGTAVLTMTPNRFYWFYRYRTEAGWLGAAALSLVIAASMFHLHRRSRLAECVRALALEHSPDGFILLDRRGRVRWMNETLHRHLGLTGSSRRERIRRQSLEDAAPDLAAFCRSTIETQPPTERSDACRIPVDGAARTMAVVADPVLAEVPGDPHWLVRVRGRNTNPGLDESTTWAMMAQRVAHSLKNPLTSILLTLQRLQMEYRERTPAVANRLDRYSTRIEGRIEELRQLTQNFLKFVDLQAPELTDVDLNALVTSFADATRRSLPPDIRLVLKLDSDLPSITVDREQLHSVLDNLVTNAINAMADGGVITISTRVARHVRVGQRTEEADYVELEVLDTGAGIPAGIRPRLFEPGFSTAEDGSGLGLAIVQKVVEDHGGTITVQSEDGTGSAFAVYLPLREERSHTPDSDRPRHTTGDATAPT